VEEPPRRARPSVVRMLEYASYISGYPRASKAKPKPGTKKKTTGKNYRRR